MFKHTVLKFLEEILTQLKVIRMNVDQENVVLNEVLATIKKGTAEVVGKINDLENSLTDTEVTPETQGILDELVSAASALDNIVPDAPAPTDTGIPSPEVTSTAVIAE